MRLNSVLKQRAVDSLRNNWLKVFAVILICFAVSFVFSSVFTVFTVDIQSQMNVNDSQYAQGAISDKVYVFNYIELITKILPFYAISIAGELVTLCLSLALCNYYLSVALNANAELSVFFDGLRRWKESFVLYLLMTVMIFLWSLLLIIPGIVKAFSYSMAPFIKAQHPELSARECLSQSRQIMLGRKGDLFRLMLSFLGWLLLSALAVGVVDLVLTKTLAIVSPLAASLIYSALSAVLLAPFYAYYNVTVAHYYIEIMQLNVPMDEQPPEQPEYPFDI